MRTCEQGRTSLVRGESRHHPGKRVSNRRILACSGRKTTAVFARGVLCTFWPQKVPKTPRQMPPHPTCRLTLAPGARLKGGFKGRWAAERVISDTTLSLLKPASYAGTFSRDFVSRLRHRAGIIRRGSVFSAGRRSEHANKGCSPLFACSRVRKAGFIRPRMQNADSAHTLHLRLHFITHITWVNAPCNGCNAVKRHTLFPII